MKLMSGEKQEQKKKKKKKQLAILKSKKVESAFLPELSEILDELEKEICRYSNLPKM